MMKFSIRFLVLLSITLSGMFAPSLSAHHFKGLPHYNYFENYPQIPEDEFLGQSGSYEFSLVIYDFQGINRDVLDAPETVRLFLVVFNMISSEVYIGPATLEILDKAKVVYSERQESAELENLYSIHQDLPDSGKYSLRITLHGRNDLQVIIPFTLSSQKTHWGSWVGSILLLVIVVAAIGGRKARLAKDRAEAKTLEREKQKI